MDSEESKATIRHTRAVNRNRKWKLSGKWNSCTEEQPEIKHGKWRDESDISVDDINSWKTVNRMTLSQERMYEQSLRHRFYLKGTNRGKMKDRIGYNNVSVMKLKLDTIPMEGASEDGAITAYINLAFPGASLSVKFDSVEEGVCLTHVEENGAAGIAGIPSGAMVFGVDGYRVHSAYDFKRALRIVAKSGRQDFEMVYMPSHIVVDPTHRRYMDSFWYRNDLRDKLQVTKIKVHPLSQYSAGSSGRRLPSKRSQPNQIVLFDR